VRVHAWRASYPSELGRMHRLLLRAPVARDRVRRVWKPLTPLARGVTGVHIGDLVFGVPDYMGYPTAGASDFAILAQKVSTWSKPPRCRRPSKRPRAVSICSDWHRAKRFWSTAGGRRPDSQPFRSALLRGAHVIAAAGETFAGPLARSRRQGDALRRWKRLSGFVRWRVGGASFCSAHCVGHWRAARSHHDRGR